MKIYILVLTIFIILGFSCEKHNVSITENTDIQDCYESQIDTLIGQKHNEGIADFVEYFSRNKKSNLSTEEQLRSVELYFEEYYQVDVTSVTGELVNSLESSDSINQIPFHENIQIENIILSQSGKYSEYFISKIMQIYDFSEENKGNFSLIKSNVEKWINIAYTDDDFSQEEQVLYINMLYVYGSSLDFWSKKFTGKPDEDDYWKVPVTDWVCGIFGSFAGPATAVIGYLSGSAAAAISIL